MTVMHAGSSKGQCTDLFCCGVCVGLIKPSVLPHLLLYTDVFETEVVNGKVSSVKLSSLLSDVKKRTDAINSVFRDLKAKNVFSCLKGWRDEVHSLSGELL